MKKIIPFILIAIVIAVGWGLKNSRAPHRGLASVEEFPAARELLINQVNLTWQKNESGILFRIEDGSSDMCSRWGQLKIVFKAEGLAYSGEVDKVEQVTNCEDNRFQQTWIPRLTEVESSNIQKMGVFQEEPPMWVLDYLSLTGSTGTETMTAEEVENYYGSIPTMEP